MNNNLFVAGLICISAIPFQLYAADISLEPLVVSATRFEYQGVASAAHIKVLDRALIEESGALHLVDLMRTRGGVQISDTFGDGSRATISMRGFGSNAAANTLVLVDGRRLNNTDLRGPDLNSIPLQDVERIEIIQGSSGALFGDQAVGGVINIITRKPDGPDIHIEIGAGSYSSQLQRIQASNRHQNGVNYQVSAERRASNNYRDNNETMFNNARLRAGLDYASGEVFAEYQHTDEDLNLPGGLFADERAISRKQTNFPTDFNDTRSRVWRLGGQQSLGSNWSMQGEYTYRHVETEGLLTGIGLEQVRHDRSLNPRLVGHYGINGGELLLTLGADIEEHEYSLTSVFGRTANDQDMRSLYGQLIMPIVDYLTVTAGIRKAWVDNRLFDGTTPIAGLELNDDQLVYSFGVVLKPSDSVRLFLRRDENYRFPLVDEQTNTDPGFVSVMPLQTQTGVSVEFGFEISKASWQASVMGYRTRMKNEIDFDPSLGFGFCCNTNLDPTERLGVIVDVFAALGDHWDWTGQYNYVDATFSQGTFAGNEIPFVAEHQFSSTLGYRFSENFRLSGELLARSSRFASGDIGNSTAKVAGFTIMNLLADYQRGPWRLTARVDNLLDKEYSEFAGRVYRATTFAFETGFFPMPERRGMLSLSYNFF